MTAYQFFQRLNRFLGMVWLGCFAFAILSVVASLLFLGTDAPVEIVAKWAFIVLAILSFIWSLAWFMAKLLEPFRHD